MTKDDWGWITSMGRGSQAYWLQRCGGKCWVCFHYFWTVEEVKSSSLKCIKKSQWSILHSAQCKAPLWEQQRGWSDEGGRRVSGYGGLRSSQLPSPLGCICPDSALAWKLAEPAELSTGPPRQLLSDPGVPSLVLWCHCSGGGGGRDEESKMGLLCVYLKVTVMHLAQLVWAGPGLSSENSSASHSGGSWSPHPLWASHSPRGGLIMPGLLCSWIVTGLIESIYNAHALTMFQIIFSAHVIPKSLKSNL